MPRYVLKPQKDVDEYVYWSTVVDAPVSNVGNREEMAEFLKVEMARHGSAPTDEETEARLTRADINGHSFQDWNVPAWDDEEIVRLGSLDPQICGTVKHSDISDLVRAYTAGDIDALNRLVTPDENDD